METQDYRSVLEKLDRNIDRTLERLELLGERLVKLEAVFDAQKELSSKIWSEEIPQIERSLIQLSKEMKQTEHKLTQLEVTDEKLNSKINTINTKLTVYGSILAGIATFGSKILEVILK
jgi:uncharacterized protein (DUF342 family)